MNTVEELRKAFAQGHVLKGVDWIFDLAKALEERVERIELANLANAGIRLKEQEFLATVEERLAELERDRAHGPLEAKCTCGSGGHPRDCLKHPQGKELHALELSYEGLKDDVEALVKAIKAYRAEANRNDALISIDVYVALDNALKPFEAVKP